jgi:methylmalonyl-CoA/ethylmalonyl-CoA epimerase
VGARAIHHIGVAVENLDEAAGTYEHLLGAQLEYRETLDSQGVEAVSVRVGTGRVELLASLGEDTPVGKFIAKRGPGVHHVAYEVDDLAGELAALAAQGVELVDSEPRRGLYGLQVAFVHPDALHGVLTELVSRG